MKFSESRHVNLTESSVPDNSLPLRRLNEHIIIKFKVMFGKRKILVVQHVSANLVLDNYWARDVGQFKVLHVQIKPWEVFGSVEAAWKVSPNWLQETMTCHSFNMPLALRGHMTNASFKQRVGVLLMPKIDRADKNYFTAEIWEETRLWETFYGTLIFQQSSMICIGRHVGGHTLALQHGGQNYFLLISC